MVVLHAVPAALCRAYDQAPRTPRSLPDTIFLPVCICGRKCAKRRVKCHPARVCSQRAAILCDKPRTIRDAISLADSYYYCSWVKCHRGMVNGIFLDRKYSANITLLRRHLQLQLGTPLNAGGNGINTAFYDFAHA